MSTTMKTPGVYIQELDAFGNAVVPIPTAIPAFIGYTANTSFNGKSLINKPVKVTSLTEFLSIFGSTPPEVQFTIDAIPAPTGGGGKSGDDASKPAPAEPDFEINGTGYSVAPSTINYRMYSGLKHFYENGGGTCYIITIGAYDFTQTTIADAGAFTHAIKLLEKEMEPTMLVIPDLIEIKDPTSTDLQGKYANAYSLQGDMINHCGTMQNRVAILDIPGGFKEYAPGDPSSVDQFRNSVEPSIPKFNSYAAAYYPWLHTTVFQNSEVSSKNIAAASIAGVQALLTAEFTPAGGTIKPDVAALIAALAPAPAKKADAKDADSKAADPKAADSGKAAGPKPPTAEAADATFKNISKTYQLVIKSILEHMNLMAPSSAMAGIYTSVDNNEGVWVAPANVGVQGTIMPSIKIDHATQEDLNVPLAGKSVGAIRAFTGRGNLVWGARTLDGNSNDWRYVNVRRTMIFIEQSVKDAAKAYVFAPNDASTWVEVESMIANFLTDLWKQGALVGPKPADAFSVSVGLGSTMTSEDILLGIMRVAVKVAVSHPAEFIEITFQQEMQKG